MKLPKSHFSQTFTKKLFSGAMFVFCLAAPSFIFPQTAEKKANRDLLAMISAVGIENTGNPTEEKKDQEHYDLYRNSFNEGFVLLVRANFLGSITLPRMNQADLNTLKASALGGGAGFIIDGEAEFGYIFGKDKWFSNAKSKTLSGMGVSVTLGVGQGFVAQKLSGTYTDGAEQKPIDLFFSIEYLPAVTFGISQRLYFFYNRMAIGMWLGGKAFVDNAPLFYFYSQESAKFPTTVGTLVITEDMRKKINNVMFSMKGFIEYYQPIVTKMQMVLRLYAAYNVFKPNYIVLPITVEKTNVFDASQKFSSLSLDSLEMGLSVALAFKT